MLKLLISFVVGLVIMTASAYASPAYAASASLVLTQIQAGGSGAALQELIILFNNSSEEVDITQWCLKNKSGAAFACFEYPGSSDHMILPAHRYATVASTAFAGTQQFQSLSVIYEPTNHSSGSIVGGGDSITLVDALGAIVDAHTWTTSLTAGMAYVRQLSPIDPMAFVDTDQSTDWTIEWPMSFIESQVIRREGPPDSCPNLAGLQSEIPNGYSLNEHNECVPPLRQLDLTELLPNASGNDSGKEFVELYNSNDESVSLANYVLWVGVNFEKTYAFPDVSIEPKSYLVFDNVTIGYSLANTSGRVRLTTLSGEIVSETDLYEKPKDDQSWALIGGMWQYTNQPTPGAENRAMLEEAKNPSSSSGSHLKPCRHDQYRSPETNRCRLIATSQKTRTPCKPNQYRSPETNRCRNLASTDIGPKPCKEGQERNPDTNRCRTIKNLASADYAVLGTETSSGGINWYAWAAIGGILLVALAYAVWEWHDEIRKLFIKMRGFVRIRK